MRAALLGVIVLAAAALHLGAAPADATVVWAVGDGAVTNPRDEAVAARIQQEGVDRFLYLGDVYEHGTSEEFQQNYHPSFGRFRSISSPTPGNHEWSNRATGYDPYWGSRAPQTSGGHFYSFDLDGWRFISLNSEEDASAGSAQLQWLRRDLATYEGDCAIAFFHKPRFSAGPSPKSNTTFEPFWAALAGRAVAVLSGHDHNYQRLAPERGITQFVVGTGGRTHYATDEADPRLQRAHDTVDGALRIVLERGRATYEFVGVDGARLDAGTLTCTPPSLPPTAPGGPPPSGSAPAPGPGPAPGTSAPAAARVRIAAPRDRAIHTRRLRRLRGSATRPEGSRVALTLVRRRGRDCRAFDGRTRSFRGSCRRPPLLRPAGGASWRLTLPPRPRPGTYRLVARVTEGTRVLTRDAVTFRVR